MGHGPQFQTGGLYQRVFPFPLPDTGAPGVDYLTEWHQSAKHM